MNYLKQIIKGRRAFVVFYLALGVFLAFLNNYSAAYFQQILDRFAGRTLTPGVILFYGALLALLHLLYYLEEYPSGKLEHGIYLDLKVMALEKLSRIDYLEYQRLGSGTLIQRVENGAQAGRNILFSFFFCLVRELLPTMGFCMIFIGRISKKVLLAVLVGYVLVFLVSQLLLRALYRIKERVLGAEEHLSHYLVRGFMELTVFRVNRRFGEELKRAREAKEEIVSSKVKMSLIHEAFFVVFALLMTAAKIGVIWYGWASGTMTVGEITALITLLGNAYQPIAVFSVLFVQYRLDQAAFARYRDFLDKREEPCLTQGADLPRLKGEIEFSHLGFSYGKRALFRDFGLHIPVGQRVALVGESGCGKSTLLKLLMGLLRPEQGAVLLDGQDLSAFCLEGLYRQTLYISQESPVFDGTLRENLALGREIPEPALWEALEAVELSPLCARLEKELDTPVGERGASLSGGERQRLAMARLWFSDAKIVILDEATSALDNRTEEAVLSRVLERLADCTVLSVAHRLTSVREFDRILVFKEGRIAAQGDWDTLLRESPDFRELYEKGNAR